MAEELELLYSQLNGQSNEDIKAAEKMLLEAYKNPSTVINLFELIGNEQSKYRQSAAVGLRLCLKHFWSNPEISQSDKEEVKQQLLKMLSTEKVLLIAKNVIESCENVFETEAGEWTDLFEFIANNRSTKLQLQIVLYLITNSVRYFKDGFVEENYQLFQEIAQEGVNTEDEETMILTSEMLGALISFISPDKINLWEQQQTFLIEYFINILSTTETKNNYDTVIGKIIYALADSFQSDVLAIPAQAIIQQIIQTLEEQQIPKDRYSFAFIVIDYLIKEHADDLIDDVEMILKAIIYYGAQSLNEEDESSFSDLVLFANAAADLAGELKMPRFLKLVQSLVPEDQNSPSFISYAYVLCFSADECESEVANDIKPIVEATIQFIDSPNWYIKEIGAQLAVIIGDDLEPSQIDMVSTLIPHLLTLIDAENLPYTRTSFAAIISLLNQGLSQASLVSQIFETVISVLENEEMRGYHDTSMEAIQSVIFALEEDVLPYANQILPIIIKGATISSDDPNLESIKRQSIIALGMLLRFGSEAIENNIQEAIELILSSTDLNDIEMNHSVLFALGNLIISHLPILVNYREKIIEIIDGVTSYLFNSILSNDYDESQEKEVVLFNYAIQGFTDTFSIMKWIFKSYNELAPDQPADWMFTIIKFMTAPFVELQARSIVAGFYGTAMILSRNPDIDQPPQYFDVLIQLFQSQDPTVVGKCFSAFRYFIKMNLFFNDKEKLHFTQKYLEEAINYGLTALKGNLEMQTAKNCFDLHSSKNLFKFFKALFKAYPDNFPLPQYVSLFKDVMKEDRQLFEMAHFIDVINYIYDKQHSNLPSLSKKAMIKSMLQSFERFGKSFTEDDEDYSAFSVPPTPLASMCLFLKYDSELIKDCYSDILELINVILNYDFNGERFYNQTITNAINFLLVSFELNSDNFDFGNWFPLILKNLPIKLMGDEKLSEHIYSVILNTISNPDVVQHFGSDLLRILIQTLGAKNKLFKRYKFSSSTLKKIVGAINNLISASDQNLEAMKELLPDDQSYSKLCARLEEFK